MILYHGTDVLSADKICDLGINLKCGSLNSDFGQGFYTTENYDRAVAWAKHKAELRGRRPTVIMMEFNDFKAKSFIEKFSDDLRWGRFIINNRNGQKYIKKMSFQENNLDARYAITYGRIADLRIIDVANQLKESNEMLNDVSLILNKSFPNQYAFHSPEALSFLNEIRRCKGGI